MLIDPPRPRRSATRLILLAISVAACLGLVACGGSGGTSSSTTASTSSSAGQPAAGRFAALRACLQKSGITLPQRTPGQRPRGGSDGPSGSGRSGGLLGGGSGAPKGGPKLPAGVTSAQYQAALKKCGGGSGFARGGAGGRLNSGAFRQALTKLSTCMRQSGIDLPTPNTSGKGPVFNTKGLDTSSSKFKTAYAKCQSTLRGSFQRQPGGGAPAAGAPGAAG
jgi:hypothetical protein